MNNIKKLIIIFFNVLTVFILSYLCLIRFIPRLPKEIFELVTVEQGLVYFILLLSNVCLVIYLLYLKVSNSTVTTGYYISHWINQSFDKFMDYIIKIPYIDYPISYITYYFIKIPIKYFKYLIYSSYTLVILILSFDVFYLQEFKQSMKVNSD